MDKATRKSIFTPLQPRDLLDKSKLVAGIDRIRKVMGLVKAALNAFNDEAEVEEDEEDLEVEPHLDTASLQGAFRVEIAVECLKADGVLNLTKDSIVPLLYDTSPQSFWCVLAQPPLRR